MRCPQCNTLGIDTALSCAFCGHTFQVGGEERGATMPEEALIEDPFEDVVDDVPAEDVCDSCGAPMRAGRDMCDACERAFSSVLNAHRPVTEPEPVDGGQPIDAPPQPQPEPAPVADTAAASAIASPPEPWWKAQRRQLASSPASAPPAPGGPPAESPSTRTEAGRPRASAAAPPPWPAPSVAPAHVPEPRRLVPRAKPRQVFRAPRRLVRPAFVAAAAMTAAVALGLPAGFRAGLIPPWSLDRSPIDARPLPDPFGVSQDGTTGGGAASAGARGLAVTPSTSVVTTEATDATRRPDRRATSVRPRRPAKKPTTEEPPRSDARPAAPAVEPLPVAPMADPLVLSSTAPPVASAQAEMVLAGPALEPSQVDVRPDVQTRVPPLLPEGLRNRTIEDVVVLRVLVLPSGKASDVRVLRASKVDASVDAAAVAAVRQWRFTPARKGGQAVSCWFSVGVPIRSGR